jgi:hypothetical protein
MAKGQEGGVAMEVTCLQPVPPQGHLHCAGHPD